MTDSVNHEDTASVFESINFLLMQEKIGRSLFRVEAVSDAYRLTIQKGSASNPSLNESKMLTREEAQELLSSLTALGVLEWKDSYGDTSNPGKLKWMFAIIFKKNVYEVSSRGGSDYPCNFANFLDELYELGFPRVSAMPAPALPDELTDLMESLPDSLIEQLSEEPVKKSSFSGLDGIEGLGDLQGLGIDLAQLRRLGQLPTGSSSPQIGALGALFGALSSLGGIENFDPESVRNSDGSPNFARIADILGRHALEGPGSSDLRQVLNEMRDSPDRFRARMRSEYRSLRPEYRTLIIDYLAETGMAPREWWKNWLE